MYQLTTHASFDSAHFLSGYEGKCSNIHGHRWKLEVTVQNETLEQTGQMRGMIVDFGQLKDDIKKLADEFDHSLIIEDGTLKEKWEIKTRTEENGKNILPDIAQAVNDHSKANSFDKEDVIGLGVGVPGAVLEFSKVNECVNLGWANIANEYATKRYRSNLINWGMLPFTIDKGELPFKNKDYIFVPDVRKAVEDKLTKIPAYVVNEGMKEITLTLGELTDDEREIILKGCLINYYRD